MKPMVILDISDMTDIRQLSAKELAAMQFDIIRIYCSETGCKKHARVKHFGIGAPVLWRGQWIDLNTQIFYCSIHKPKIK